MQWEMILLLHMAAPFVVYYVARDRIESCKRKRAAARLKG
jgi:hypothetical protein